MAFKDLNANALAAVLALSVVFLVGCDNPNLDQGPQQDQTELEETESGISEDEGEGGLDDLGDGGAEDENVDDEGQ